MQTIGNVYLVVYEDSDGTKDGEDEANCDHNAQTSAHNNIHLEKKLRKR